MKSIIVRIDYDESYTDAELLKVIRAAFTQAAEASGPAFGPQTRKERPVPLVSVQNP